MRFISTYRIVHSAKIKQPNVLHIARQVFTGKRLKRMWDTFYNKVPIDKEHHRHVE